MIQAWQDALLKAGWLLEAPKTLWQHPLVTVQEVSLQSPQGPLRRLILHRGTFAAACVLLKAPDSEAFLMVRQMRPVSPAPFYEHPAGMLEPGEDPRQALAREIFEETGLLFTPDDLIPLHAAPLYPSPGLWHEKGYFFAVVLTVPKAFLTAYHSPTLRQNPDEPIELLAIHPAEVLQKTTNLQTIAHTLLFWYVWSHSHHRDLPSPLI